MHAGLLCMHSRYTIHKTPHLFTQHRNRHRLRQKASISAYYHTISIQGIFGVFSAIEDSCRGELLRDEFIVRETVFEC